MRAALLVLIALVASLCHGQDLKETHGKTNAQILAMGYDKWYGFYTRIEGESTLGMSSAAILYAGALAWRNDEIIAKQGPVKQSQSKRLRELFDKFSDDMNDVGRALTGGGTIWTTIGASAQVDVEETLYALLGGRMKAAPALFTSKVNKELDLLGKDVDAMDESLVPAGFKKSDVIAQVAHAKDLFKEIVKFAKYRSRADSDRILSFCLGRVKDARQDDGKR